VHGAGMPGAKGLNSHVKGDDDRLVLLPCAASERARAPPIAIHTARRLLQNKANAQTLPAPN